MDERDGKKLHDTIGFVGLRAQATAVGLIQLTAELVAAGVLDEPALDRIKGSIAQDLALSRPPHASLEHFEAETKRKLDRLFAGQEKLESLEEAPDKKGL
ncbi:hypothetical protein [Glacieibacterium sp.]|uniref:hypothetical protein n=1 Tax=Glacieibacterium sp. TaxID=2860237 RepID=UPI003B003A3B